ncbi:MAG: glycosyltransferase 87 family protein [bacterium]|nr:glycosyltransferase 87 family protein [bacterium]
MTKESKNLPAQQPANHSNNAKPQDNEWQMTIFPITLAVVIVSFLIRWYWQELHDLFGTYPSDIWYIHINYGWFLVYSDNFSTEYPAPMLGIFRGLSWICQLFPATEATKYGGNIYSCGTWLAVNCTFLGALGILSAKYLYEIQKKLVYTTNSIYWYILSPTFVYYLFINYDMIPVTCCLASFYYLLRRDYMLSFIILGAGAAFKVFPGVLLFIFILDVPVKKRIESVLWFIAPIIIMNVPFMVRDMKTWLFPYTWQMEFDNTPMDGHIIYHLTQLLGKPGALALMAALGLWSLYLIIKTRKHAILSSFTGEEPQKESSPAPGTESDESIQDLPIAEWYAASSLVLILLFILTKNVFSPQYLIWILPFLVMFKPYWVKSKSSAQLPCYPFWGIAIVVELINCCECFFLDYWRSGHMEGIVAIRSIRELALLALLAYCLYFFKRLSKKNGVN